MQLTQTRTGKRRSAPKLVNNNHPGSAKANDSDVDRKTVSFYYYFFCCCCVCEYHDGSGRQRLTAASEWAPARILRSTLGYSSKHKNSRQKKKSGELRTRDRAVIIISVCVWSLCRPIDMEKEERTEVHLQHPPLCVLITFIVIIIS